MNKRLFLLLLIFCFLFTGCFVNKRNIRAYNYSPDYSNIHFDMENVDTLEQDFYYECVIPYFKLGDVINYGNFVTVEDVMKKTYNSYYEVVAQNLKFSDEINTENVFRKLKKQMYLLTQTNFRAKNGTTIKKGCNLYYKKVKLKLVVLFIGKQFQRVPAFMTCQDFEANKPKGYTKYNFTLKKVPTYIILNVLETSWQFNPPNSMKDVLDECYPNCD